MLKRMRERLKNLSSNMSGTVLIYTFFWLILTSLILFIFYKNNKSFIWNYDSYYQCYASFGYLCDYLKDLIYNFHFDGFFNFTLGQGMDVLTTLNSYDLTDPISILCACVLPLSRSGRYTLMLFIKLYLIGISFLFYCHVIDRNKGMATIAGAITYVFSGAILFFWAREPYFINWAYFFPFLLGGIELYFRKRKKLPLILVVFFNLITSYYTFYMNAILAAIYVLIHVICRVVKEKKWTVLQEEFIKCLKLAGVCCIGILLSACILLPTIYTYLNSNRVAELTGYTASALVYNNGFYKNLFEDFFAPYHDSGYQTIIGFNIILIVPLILIFTKRKKYTEIKALFLISLVMLGIPIVGRIMNGFGYAANRWTYALPFYASVIFVILFDDIKSMTEKEQAIVLLTTIVYVSLCFLHTGTNENVLKIATMVMLIATVAIISIALRYKYPAAEPLILTLVFLCAGFSIYFTFSEQEGNYVSEYHDNATIYSNYENFSSTAAVGLTENNNFYRIEMKETQTNVNGNNNVNGTGFWWSTVPANMMDYYTNLAIDTVIDNSSAAGLDGRSGLLELAGVKYYTKPSEEDGNIGLIPYGYKEVPSRDNRYQVFENTYALPIGYTYTDYISSSAYEKMNGIEKEQALLQSAVLDQDLGGFKKTDAQFDYTILDYTIGKMEGVTWKDNFIEPIVRGTDETREVTLQVNVPDDCEIYVYISGVEVDPTETSKFIVTVTREKGAYSVSKSSQISNLSFNWTPMQDDVAFNLGTGYAGENTITISFNKSDSLSFDDLQVIAVPMSTYERYAEALGEYVLENVSVKEDHISGTISVPDARILQFSVPYSDGWKAYVDGEEVSLMKSDVMYMAILISAGDHTVELYYETPYLRIGIAVTIATAVLYAAYEIIRHRRNKGVQKNG